MFDTAAVLIAIRPHSGRTIDGLAVGQPLSKAVELYGPAVHTSDSADGTHIGVFTADVKEGNGYSISYSGYGATATITRIVLYRCLPENATPSAQPVPTTSAPAKSLPAAPGSASLGACGKCAVTSTLDIDHPTWDWLRIFVLKEGDG